MGRSLKYCTKHYVRFKKYGDASVVQKSGTPIRPLEAIDKGSYFEIPLANSKKVALISKEDMELTKLRWRLDNDGYAECTSKRSNKRMHRHIFTDIPQGLVPDHINRDRLDSRRENLRLVTFRENTLNRKFKNNTSGRVGVRWHKVANRYIANIRVNGKLLHLGYFDDIKDAAKVRREAEINYGYINGEL